MSFIARCSLAAAFLLYSAAPGAAEAPDVGKDPRWVLAIHGGAGVKERDELTPDLERQYRTTLNSALEAGAAVLRSGGRGDAAVVAALVVLEDSPLFNAGHGAVLDETGAARHDASIMRGDTLDAGAVAASSRIKNPIKAAHAIMEHTENVLLNGDGADWFASGQGLELAGPLYFQTESRRRALMDKRAAGPGQVAALAGDEDRYGTVGAVVLDQAGNIFAGTSTGGRTNKRFGRVGDSPVIGAGTYASNSSCAVSGTGHGEYFMRWTVARDICARVEFAGQSLVEAADAVIVDTLKPKGGGGAVIALSPAGEVVFSMNGNGMYRGVVSSASSARTGIYAEEPVE